MSQPEPTFARQGTSPAYWLDADLGVAGFVATDPETLGPTPTLSATWGDGDGTYFFLAEAASDPSTFPAALEAYLATRRPDGPRFLWVFNPNQPPAGWTTAEVFLTAEGDSVWRVAQSADFGFTDYTLVIHSGPTVAPAEGARGWGFELGDSADAPAARFVPPLGDFPARPGTTSLSIDAATAGCWFLDIDMTPRPGDGFAELGCDLRFFTPGEDGYVQPLPFAVLRQPAKTAVAFSAALDPLRPFDHDRTQLAFDTDSSGAALDSGYVTTYGHGVTLEPRGARLVFAFAPFFSGGGSGGRYYLAPEGPFRIGVHRPPTLEALDEPDRVICGTSGLEYVGIPVGTHSDLVFVPDQAAYSSLDAGADDALSDHGTTSWLYVQSTDSTGVSPATSATSATYYAQPEDAPVFGRPKDPATPLVEREVSLLEFIELPAVDLTPQSAQYPFPMVPFRHVRPDVAPTAAALERLILAPTRRGLLTEFAERSGQTAAVAEADDAPPTARIGTTPQGLAVGIAADERTWTWLGIGTTAESAYEPDLQFTRIDGLFKQAMQTNNLFMVLGNPETFSAAGSVAYRLTQEDFQVIGTLPPDQRLPTPVFDAVKTYMSQPEHDRLYATLREFRDALIEAYAPITDGECAVFQRFAAQLTPVVENWPFRLGPDSWVNPLRADGARTYLIFKFGLGRSVTDLVGDIETWGWRDAASPEGPAYAQQQIQDVLRKAKPPSGVGGTAYDNFNAIVTEPDWTGVLALSVDVPLDQLPAPLQALAAGIDPKMFRAHHFGISVTPYQLTKEGLVFTRSSMFGLIDYQNPEDQYFSEDIPFAFRVLQLTVGIENSVITTFASRVELLVNRLFGAPTRLYPTEHGNNIILSGAYQKQRAPDGKEHDAYVFTMTGHNRFQVDGLILDSVDIMSTSLTTTKPASGPDATVEGTFAMAGDLRFIEFDRFDPFCWGPGDDGAFDGHLRFGNLSVGMSFSLGDPAGTTSFTLGDGNLSFDMANSAARPNALVSRFPVRLRQLIVTPDAEVAATAPGPPVTPAEMGFVSISCPLDQGLLSQPWYGLDYVVDLGTLGALAGSASIAIEVLAAWSPGREGTEPSTYVGVKLPGTREAFGVSLPLQGFIKLGFKSMEFLVNNEANTPRTYTLVLRDFALRVLGIALPPGRNQVVLFGNPDQGSSSKVGWYAAYAADEDPKAGGTTTQQALRAARPVLRAGG
ncbi:MAG TPA: hypothetical protein VFB78_17135 [Acidimicrobiales bacterium]|nr:hypothetical protein [Acidimicrobiales bacterium]